MPRKISRIAKTTLRLDESVLQAADVIARLEGVSVPDFIEFLIFNFAYRDTVGEPLATASNPPASASEPSEPCVRPWTARLRRSAAKVIDLATERERRRSTAAVAQPVDDPTILERPPAPAVIREHAARLRHRAGDARTRAAAARQAAVHARRRASDTLARTAWVWDFLLKSGAPSPVR